MPLMMDDEEIEKRLKHPENAIVKYSGSGKPEGTKSKSERRVIKPETKAFIGAFAKLDGVKNIARVFEFPQSTVSSFKNASTNTNQNIDIRNKQEEILKSSREIALDRLMESLGAITDAKLQ